MKINSSLIGLFLLVLILGTPAAAATFEEFREISRKAFSGEIEEDVFLKICDKVITKDAVGNNKYLSLAHSFRSSIYWTMNDLPKARAEAQKALELDPGNVVGFMNMSDITQAEGNFAAAENWLNVSLQKGNLEEASLFFFNDPRRISGVKEMLQKLLADVRNTQSAKKIRHY